jgi:hypothetical protein
VVSCYDYSLTIGAVEFKSDDVSLTLAWCGKTEHGGSSSRGDSDIPLLVVQSYAENTPRRMTAPVHQHSTAPHT